MGNSISTNVEQELPNVDDYILKNSDIVKTEMSGININEYIHEFFKNSKENFDEYEMTLDKGIQVDDNFDQIQVDDKYIRKWISCDVFLRGLYIVLSEYMYKGIGGIFTYMIESVTGVTPSVFEINLDEKGIDIQSIKNTYKNNESPYTIISVTANKKDQKIFVLERGINSIQMTLYEKCDSDQYIYDKMVIVDKIKNFVNKKTGKNVIFILPSCYMGVAGSYFNQINMGYCEIFGLYWFYASLCIKTAVNGTIKHNLETYYGIDSPAHVIIDALLMDGGKKIENLIVSKFDNTKDLHEYLINSVYTIFTEYSDETGIDYDGNLYNLFNEKEWDCMKTNTEEIVTKELLVSLTEGGVNSQNYIFPLPKDNESPFDCFIKSINRNIQITYSDKS